MEFGKETLMGDMLAYDSDIGGLLMAHGMHCVTCPASLGESLEEACMVHGLDTEEVLKDINEYLASKK